MIIDGEEILFVPDIAERLGLDKKTIREYIRMGRIPAYKVGRRYAVTARDLLEGFIKSRPVATATEKKENL